MSNKLLSFYLVASSKRPQQPRHPLQKGQQNNRKKRKTARTTMSSHLSSFAGRHDGRGLGGRMNNSRHEPYNFNFSDLIECPLERKCHLASFWSNGYIFWETVWWHWIWIMNLKPCLSLRQRLVQKHKSDGGRNSGLTSGIPSPYSRLSISVTY